MRDAGGFVGHQAARSAALQELVAQAALAEPGVTDDADDLGVAVAGACQRRLEHLHLVAAADEAREAAAAGDVEARAHLPEPLQLVHMHRPLHAFDLHLAQIGEREVSSDHLSVAPTLCAEACGLLQRRSRKAHLQTVGDPQWKETASMQTPCNDGVKQQHPAKEELLAELHMWERQLVFHSLNEAIRLIESDKIEKLSGQHICCIAEYDAITIDGERFFDNAFSSGKEVAACFAFAMEIGWREALDDMRRLRLTLSGRGGSAVAGEPSE